MGAPLLICLFLLFSPNTLMASDKQVITIVSPSGYWAESVVTQLVEEAHLTSPESEVEVMQLNPTHLDYSPNWRVEMEGVMTQIRRNGDQQQLVALVGDVVWTLYSELDKGEFRDIPLLLCGVKRYSLSYGAMCNLATLSSDSLMLTQERMERYPKSQWVYEPVMEQIETSVEQMLKLHPETEQIAFVSSSRFYGVYSRVVFEMVMNSRFPQLKPHYMDGRTINSHTLKQQLLELPERSLLLISSWYEAKEEDRITLEFWNDLPPIYLLADNRWTADKAVAGFYPKRTAFATASASMLRAMLRGEKPDKLRVVGHWWVNQQEMQRLGLDERLFAPEESTLYNLSGSWWSNHRRVISSCTAIVLLALLIAYFRKGKAGIK